MSAPPSTIRDWTRGEPGLAFERCRACGHAQYARRGFCSACGSRELELLQSSGRGTLYAVTVVARAPTAELRAFAPYSLVLVDLDKGPRVVGHGAPELTIGRLVQATFRPFGDRLVPYFDALE